MREKLQFRTQFLFMLMHPYVIAINITLRYAAVYLTAGMENLLEEMVLQCLPPEDDHMLTASVLEHAIANNGDLWGLLQPYAHLNAGRTATGAVSFIL